MVPTTSGSYGEIAEALNRPGAARAVGHALGRNPVPLIIPCHRVLASDGKLGGFSAYGGQATKARLLAEGRRITEAYNGSGASGGVLAPRPEFDSGFSYTSRADRDIIRELVDLEPR